MTDDEFRLLTIHRLMDGVGGVDLHERAAQIAKDAGHEEPQDADYLIATREALDVVVKDEFSVTLTPHQDRSKR